VRRAWWGAVRLGFRLLYHEMAFTYDGVANVVSLGQWWAWQGAALGFLPPPQQGRLLELAFGTGRFHAQLHQAGYDVVGLDFSRQMGRIARGRLPQARLLRGKAQALPFAEGSFAAVVCTFPTPFIVEEPTLAEVRRVLRPGGRLVVVPNAVLTRGGAAKELLEGAYRATGQREPWGIELGARFGAAGLALHLHQVELPRSMVTVLVAERP